MNRRGFFAGLLGAVVAPALLRAAPLALAYVDSGHTFCAMDFRSATAIRAYHRELERSRNRFLTPQQITREALRVLQQNLQAARSIDLNYALEFAR